MFHEPWQFEVDDAQEESSQPRRVWSRLPDVCLKYDKIILWIDPDPNAQLLLLQLLDWLGQIPEILPRLWLKQSESATGERRQGDWATPPRPVEPADVKLTSRAWAAFRTSTPEAWAALHDCPDIQRFPGLKRAVQQMLEELPDATGLGATERQLLRLAERSFWWHEAERHKNHVSSSMLRASEGGTMRLVGRVLTCDERLPLGYFEVGETLCCLAAAPVPAFAGVTEPTFSLAMHDNPERYRLFCESTVSLTGLGHRLVAGDDDWSRHNPIHRWWGGTQLTSDALWRWDVACRRLCSPN